MIIECKLELAEQGPAFVDWKPIVMQLVYGHSRASFIRPK